MAAKGKPAGFHNPRKVWATIGKAFIEPDRVMAPDILPPRVEVSIKQKPDKEKDLIVKLSAARQIAEPQHEVTRAVLYINDTLYAPGVAIKNDGTVDAEITIDRKLLAHGDNEIRLVCVNGRGIEKEDSRPVVYDDDAKVSRKLYAVCVGIDDYTGVKGFGAIRSLNCAAKDAEEVARVLRQHRKSNLFTESTVEHILQKDATAANILERIRELGKQAGPDDLFVLFLSGHGEAEQTDDGEFKRGSFFYICRDSERRVKESLLHAREVRQALERITARKLVLVDACRS